MAPYSSLAFRRTPTTLFSDDAASALMAGMALVALVALVVAVLLVGKAVLFVVRVFVQYPRSRALWGALGVMLVAWGAALLSVAQWSASSSTIVAPCVLAGGATCLLVFTAWLVDVLHEQRFQRERSAARLISDVLTQPWWTPAA